jgi:serine/threonine protein kinase/WD40 repeat protein
MESSDINRWCDLYEELLRREVSPSVEEFLAAQQLPQDPSLLAELRRVYSEHHSSTLEQVVNAFAAGDYAEVIRASESEIGPQTIVEIARLRLIAFRRMEQHKSAETLAQNLLESLVGEPFEQALIKLIVGRLTRDDVLGIAKDSTERCKTLYFVAAGIRSQLGFEAARRTLTECAQMKGVHCVEQALAIKELDAAIAGHAAVHTIPTWNAGDLIAGIYRVHSTITDGAMSVVYLATHTHWGAELALKIPRPEVLSGSDAWERLSAEANTWVKLGVHPNIVTAYYTRRIGRIPVIVMEKIDGGNVKDALKTGRIVDLRRVLDIAIQVARGLVYASQRIPGFVHRDLKPANVLLTSDGTAKVADFGLAHAFGTAAGTPAYMAPEVWLQPDKASSATDIYSFGTMVFEMLTGRRPFGQQAAGRLAVVPDSVIREARLRSTVIPTPLADSDDPDRTEKFVDSFSEMGSPKQDPITSLMLAHLHQPPPRPLDLRNDIPVELSNFCLRLLEKDPTKRPSASEVVSELITFFADIAGEPYPRDDPETADLLTATCNNHALSMLDLGREEDARVLWSQAQDADPLDAAVEYNTGLFAWRNGKLTDSDLLARLNNIAADHPDPASISYLKALIHLERGDHVSALESLSGLHESMMASDGEVASLCRIAQERSSIARNQGIESETHHGAVTSVRLNTNGTKAITSGRDGTIRFWQADPDFREAFVGYHESPVTAMDVAADWSTAVSIDTEGILRCWEVASGICSHTIETGHKVLGLVRINSTGTLCLTFNSSPLEATPMLWDMRTGRRVRTFEGLKSETGCLALFSSEHDLVAAADSTSLIFWRLSTGQQLHVQNIDFSMSINRPLLIDTENRRFLSPQHNVEIVLTSWMSSGILQTFHGHKDAVVGLSGPAQLTQFASYDATQTVRLWSTQSGRCLRTFDVAADPVTALSLGANGQQLIIGRESGRVSIFRWPDLSFSAPFVLSRPPDAKWLTAISQSVQNAVRQAEAQIDADDFVSAAETINTARNRHGCGRHPKLLAVWQGLYSRIEKRCLRSVWKTRTMTSHNTIIQSVRLSEDGIRLLSVSRDGVLGVTDTTSRAVQATTLYFAVNNPQGSEGQQFEFIPEGTKADFTWAADISRNGRCAAAASGNGLIRLWDMSAGTNTATIETGKSKVLAIRFIDDGDRVASGAADGTIVVHDLQSLQRLHLFKGHTDAVTAIAVVHDRHHLISAGEDQTIRVWDLDSGQCLAVFGDLESGPLVPASQYHARAQGLDSLIRTLTLREVDYLHRPLRWRAKRVRSICADHTGTKSLRAIGTQLELWDLTTKTLIRSIDAHTKQILSAEMTSDGCFAVSAGADLWIHFWNLTTGQRLNSVQTSQEPWSVCLSGDGRFLVSGEFGQLVLWTLDWSLTTDTSTSAEDRAAAGVGLSPADDFEDLSALVNQFLLRAGPAREELAKQIVTLPWSKIRGIQPILTDCVPKLVESLDSMSADDAACQAVAYLLSATGVAAVNQLRAFLKRSSSHSRMLAVVTLGRIGAASESAIPEIIAILGGNREFATVASHCLFSIGPQSIPHLCLSLEHMDENIQRQSLHVLSRFGPMADIAGPAIVKMASQTQDAGLRQEAMRALICIVNPDAAKLTSTSAVKTRGVLWRIMFVTCVIILCWWGLGAFSRYSEREALRQQANEAARQKIRRANEIVAIWTGGVRLDSVPSELPEDATRLLNEVTGSVADQQFKSEAVNIRLSMRNNGPFFVFANRISSFLPYLRDLDSLIVPEVAPNVISHDSNGPPGTLRSDFLILTVPFANSDQGGELIPVPLLDADLMRVIGEGCATSPEELGTIIILQWSRTQIGEREVAFDGGSNIGRASRNRYGCRMTAIAMPSRMVVFLKHLQSNDRERLHLMISPNGRHIHQDSSADGYVMLRETVKKELVKLCSDAASP